MSTGSQLAWRDEPVVLVEYDPQWPAVFAAEVPLLEAAIGPWITGGIHHVGSTAVPGMAAKPIVDILVGVSDLASVRPDVIERLAPLGYCHAPYLPDQMVWFCKPDPARRTHHLHLVPSGSRRFHDEIAFRDQLRAHPEQARAYEALKRALAARFRNDREAYTAGKTDFVGAALAQAGAIPVARSGRSSEDPFPEALEGNAPRQRRRLRRRQNGA